MNNKYLNAFEAGRLSDEYYLNYSSDVLTSINERINKACADGLRFIEFEDVGLWDVEVKSLNLRGFIVEKVGVKDKISKDVKGRDICHMVQKLKISW